MTATQRINLMEEITHLHNNMKDFLDNFRTAKWMLAKPPEKYWVVRMNMNYYYRDTFEDAVNFCNYWNLDVNTGIIQCHYMPTYERQEEAKA